MTHFNWSLWIINVSAKFETFLTRRYILIFVILVGWMHHTVTLHSISYKVWTEQAPTSQSKISSASVSQSVLGILSVLLLNISESWESDPPGVPGWSCWPVTLHKDLIYWEKFYSWIPAILIIHVIIENKLNWQIKSQLNWVNGQLEESEISFYWAHQGGVIYMPGTIIKTLEPI